MGLQTFDKYTLDSTGAFLVGELERLDQRLNLPLVNFTYTRDIKFRTDVSMADELSSFTNSTFAAAGGINPTGKSWIGKNSNAITGMQLDIGKTANPLSLWGMELTYTIPELLSAQALGRPVDEQKYQGIMLKYHMDSDEMVYRGDTGLGVYGLCNNTSMVTPSNVAAGASGSRLWSQKTPDEIVYDVNELIQSVYAASGYAVAPTNLLLSPPAFAYLVSQKVSMAGNVSILQYLYDNTISNALNGRPLDIKPVKWLVGGGEGGTVGTSAGYDRMVAYTNDESRVRWPMVPMQRTPLEYRSIFHLTTYFAKMGVVEMVYPETIGYRDLYF